MKLYIGLFLWMSSATAGIFWFGSDSLKDFDPQMKLSSQLMSLDFEKTLVSKLPINEKPVIYHIIDDRCPCSWLGNAHRAQLDKWASAENIQTKTISLDEYRDLSEFVPSTPATLVVGENSELVYFGPYSQGSGCLQSSGLVDARIKPYFENRNSNARMIITDTKGCYCENRANRT